jgi:DNA invertase Pin-like site-specific DNA recombinase
VVTGAGVLNSEHLSGTAGFPLEKEPYQIPAKAAIFNAAYITKRPLLYVKKLVDLSRPRVTGLSMSKKYVSYLRVSTARQGESGLGLEAQRSAVVNYVNSLPDGAEIVREFVEIETGKRADRPVLAEAIRECKANDCILLVAKLDRLSRNLHFVTALMNSKVDFVASDNPHATPFLIHILVAVAEHERNMISNRTKLALEAAKRRGVKLGNPQYQDAISKAVEARQKIAADRNAGLRKMVAEVMEKTGLSKLADIAQALNLRGIKTNRGSQFTPTQIHRLLKTA